MERSGTCSGRVGSGCGDGLCRATPSSGGPRESGHSRSKSRSAERLPRPAADGPGAGSLDPHVQLVSQSLLRDSGT